MIPTRACLLRRRGELGLTGLGWATQGREERVESGKEAMYALARELGKRAAGREHT